MSNIYPWQQQDWTQLQVFRKRPPHALLFKGKQGIGKLELALQFAYALLCHQPNDEGFACGKCPACHWLSQGSHPDFRLVQPETLSIEADEVESTSEAKSGKKPSKQITIDQIRGLSDFFALSAHQGGRRVIVIHPAEAMNTNATNALLKNLEEPPPDLLFILVTHKPQLLLPTILSRCLSFPLTMPDVAMATQWLKQQGITDPVPTLASSGFAPLLAAKEDGQLELRQKLLQALRQPAQFDMFALSEALQKTEQAWVVHHLQQWCYDLLSLKLAGRVRYHLGEEAVMQKLVASVDPLKLAQLQKQLQTARREAQHTLNPKLFFESLFLDYGKVVGSR